jgi:L-alanine-DL-glutamate epimerase-like enolase superfamily enzyme
VGPAIRLGIDANGAWEPQTALRMIERLRVYDIVFVEQPVAPFDESWMVEVKNAVDIPIIADESVCSPHDARRLIRAGAADVFSIYIGKAAGILSALEIASEAAAAGVKCTIGSNLELGVGSAAMIHLALSAPAIDAELFPCDIIGPFYYQDELLTEVLPIRDGYAFPLEKPGLGVELDSDKLERYRVNHA